MKNKLRHFFIFCLAAIFFSCSSDSEEKNKDENKIAPKDSTSEVLAGVIEKKPPVQFGDYEEKYPSGIIKMKGYYVNGKREGQWVSFYENGNVWSEGFFKQGLRDGKSMVYYENGQKYYTGYYKDGRKVGKWEFFDEKGNKIKEESYK